MKIKNIFSFALAAFTAVTLFSCSDEVEYTPAEQLATAQVYFPSSNSSSVSLLKANNTFDVTIARVKTDDAINVALNTSST